MNFSFSISIPRCFFYFIYVPFYCNSVFLSNTLGSMSTYTVRPSTKNREQLPSNQRVHISLFFFMSYQHYIVQYLRRPRNMALTANYTEHVNRHSQYHMWQSCVTNDVISHTYTYPWSGLSGAFNRLMYGRGSCLIHKDHFRVTRSVLWKRCVILFSLQSASAYCSSGSLKRMMLNS